MKPDPAVISPDMSLQEAARKMAEIDCGVLPVGKGDDLEGIITDRDIVTRAVAKGKDVSREKVRDYMTEGVCYCSEDDSLADAAKSMQENQVARLMVKDDGGRTSGILSFGAILRKNDDSEEITEVVECATGKNAA
ncbi:MAG: CBS domain-containing protein [Pseudomonadota bacterium]|nr:CBS domain-containing protein [Pseudomonadota bacterium]